MGDAKSEASRFSYVAVAAKSIPTAVRILFLLFVFTLPFEATDLGFMTGSVSIPKIAGFLFFTCYFFYHNGLFSKRSFPPISAAMCWFLAFLAVYAANGVFLGSTEYLWAAVGSLFQLTQLIVMFWVASDLLKDDKTARSALLAFTIAASFFAIAIVLKVPGFYVELAQGRETAMGENPNAVAANSALAIVIILGLLLYTSHKKLFLVILSLPLFGAMVLSGSRGGVLAFVIGSAIYLLPYRRSKRVLTAIVFATFAISAVVYFVAKNSDFLERWEQTYYEGNLAGRENIFPIASEMILERPLLGWQPVNSGYELGRRFGGISIWREGDAHNLYLAVLLEVGVFGATPFFIGIWWCARSAWRARRGRLGLLPLALLFTVLAGSMSGTSLFAKLLWLILALSLAAGPAMPRQLEKQFPALLSRRSIKSVR
jgi:O-antigen ligase